ncbi:unnamed protein product [Sphagnum balticum]
MFKGKCSESEKIAGGFLEEKENFVRKALASEEKIVKLSGRVSSLKEELAAVNRKLQEAMLHEQENARELAALKELAVLK